MQDTSNLSRNYFALSNIARLELLGFSEVAAEVLNGADFHLAAALQGIRTHVWREQNAGTELVNESETLCCFS